jgi:hypothetical protein
MTDDVLKARNRLLKALNHYGFSARKALPPGENTEHYLVYDRRVFNDSPEDAVGSITVFPHSAGVCCSSDDARTLDVFRKMAKEADMNLYTPPVRRGPDADFISLLPLF